MRGRLAVAMMVALWALPALAGESGCGCPMAVPDPAPAPKAPVSATQLAQRLAEVRYELFVVDYAESSDTCREGKWEELRSLEHACHVQRLAEAKLQKQVAQATTPAPTHIAKATPPAVETAPH